VYIDQAQSSRILRMFTQLGNRVPAHSTGSGKAMLAFGSRETAEGVVRRYGLARRTAQTITEPARFWEELARVRTRGYALDDQEHEDGVRCVAVAVRDGSGQVVASLSVSGPASRLGDAQVDQYAAEILDCGAKLSARLGYAGEPVGAR
jgi:IclR family transcriptional regulator, acetate operon repressor